MSDYSRVLQVAWVPFLVPFLLMGAAADAQVMPPAHNLPAHNGPSCELVPNVGAGRSVNLVKVDANNMWGAGNWRVVKVMNPDQVGALTVMDQHPKAGTGLTSGELMHLWVSGSEDAGGCFEKPTEKVIVIVMFIIIVVLGWRCWRK